MGYRKERKLLTWSEMYIKSFKSQLDQISQLCELHIGAPPFIYVLNSKLKKSKWPSFQSDIHTHDSSFLIQWNTYLLHKCSILNILTFLHSTASLFLSFCSCRPFLGIHQHHFLTFLLSRWLYELGSVFETWISFIFFYLFMYYFEQIFHQTAALLTFVSAASGKMSNWWFLLIELISQLKVTVQLKCMLLTSDTGLIHFSVHCGSLVMPDF